MLRIIVAGLLLGFALWATLASAEVPPIIGGTVPPPQFDHPYRGKLIVRQIDMGPYGPMGKVLKRDVQRGRCTIYVNRGWAGADLAVIVRHETGHCNGWDHNH